MKLTCSGEREKSNTMIEWPSPETILRNNIKRRQYERAICSSEIRHRMRHYSHAKENIRSAWGENKSCQWIHSPLSLNCCTPSNLSHQSLFPIKYLILNLDLPSKSSSYTKQALLIIPSLKQTSTNEPFSFPQLVVLTKLKSRLRSKLNYLTQIHRNLQNPNPSTNGSI